MRKISLAIPILISLMDIAIWLDIPIFREIIVFVFLSFIPGFILLRIMKLNERNIVDTILFSVGLSIAFSMFAGLLINELFLFGVSQPLSTIPLTIVLSFLTVILFLVYYRRSLLENLSQLKINWSETKTLISKSAILVLPPTLGLVGALFVNIPILLLLIVVIAVLYALSILSYRLIPPKLYPLLIFTISLALLFHVVFTSRYIIGFDSNGEYSVFKVAQINGHWSLFNVNIDPIVLAMANFNSMLSITILPTIYSSMLNLSGETVFKTLYPFIFSLVAVALHRIYESQISELDSLTSVFFFISGLLVFYGVSPLSLNRQIVGEFFFTLSVLIMLSKNIPINKRRLLLIVFGAALAVSHYSLMYIYLVFISFIYVVSKIKDYHDKVLNSSTVISILVIALSWYYVSVSPLSTLNQFLINFFSRFSADLLSPEARSTQTFLTQPISNVVNSISVVIFFAAHFFIAIGILGTIFKPQKIRLDPTYRTISILSTSVLFLSFALPNFAQSLNLDRFYSLSLLFLAPYFVLGFNLFFDLNKSVFWKVTGEHISRSRYDLTRTLLICLLLICFLLTQTGFVNRITGSSPLLRSLDLDRLKTSSDSQVAISFYGAYRPEQEVFSAVWLHNYQGTPSMVYADFYRASHVLVSYGMIPWQLANPFFVYITANTTILYIEPGSFVYLGRLNVVNGIIPTAYGQFNSSQILPLNRTDLIYSNGGSEILYAPSLG